MKQRGAEEIINDEAEAKGLKFALKQDLKNYRKNPLSFLKKASQ